MNFIQPSSRSNYNPLAHLHLSPEKSEGKEFPTNLEELKNFAPVANLHNELSKLNLTLDDFIVHLTKEWNQYSFHTIALPLITQETKGDELIDFDAMGEVEELEIEPLDIKQNPERVARAIQNQAFVALRHPVEEEKPVEAKFAPKWAELIEKGKIKQLKVKDEQGATERTIDVKKAEITRFTAAEVDRISTVVFQAIEVAYQIRTLEQLQREIERKKDQEELRNREKHFIEEELSERFQQLLEGLKKHREALEETDQITEEAFESMPRSKNVIMEMIERRTEEIQEREDVEKQERKKARIIKKEVEKFELKRENIKEDRQVADIKQAETKKKGA
jgi:hypothetical protein